MTVIFHRSLLQGSVDHVHHLIKTAITYGMYGYLHAMIIGIFQHGVHLLIAEQRKTSG